MRSIVAISALVITFTSCKSKRELIRPTYQVSKNVSYGKEVMSQTVDIYWRNITTNTQQSVVILMHGGGWYTGDKTNFDDLNVINIFIEYGFVVVNMNYRLAPAYKYPAPLDDIDSVIAMITAKSKLYNANTNQIFLLGKSAGGHIALQYAYSRKNERVKAAVDFLGLSDLAARDEFAVRLDTQIADFIGTPYSVAPDIWQQASPIFHMKDAIPTCIVHGTADDVVFPVQSERLNDSLELYGVPHKYITWDGYNHVLSIPVWQTSTDIVCKWLEKYKKE